MSADEVSDSEYSSEDKWSVLSWNAAVRAQANVRGAQRNWTCWTGAAGAAPRQSEVAATPRSALLAGPKHTRAKSNQAQDAGFRLGFMFEKLCSVFIGP